MSRLPMMPEAAWNSPSPISPSPVPSASSRLYAVLLLDLTVHGIEERQEDEKDDAAHDCRCDSENRKEHDGGHNHPEPKRTEVCADIQAAIAHTPASYAMRSQRRCWHFESLGPPLPRSSALHFSTSVGSCLTADCCRYLHVHTSSIVESAPVWVVLERGLGVTGFPEANDATASS
jgi:hypothetical protein